MLETIIETITGMANKETIAVTLIGFILGAYSGHKFSLSRDKRKEHNDAIRPLKGTVLKLIDDLGKGTHYSIDQDIENISTYFSENEFNKIKEACDNYNSSYTEKYFNLKRDANRVSEPMNDNDLNELIEIAEKINNLLKIK